MVSCFGKLKSNCATKMDSKKEILKIASLANPSTGSGLKGLEASHFCLMKTLVEIGHYL
jgi:hypothetical protein